MTKSSRGMSTLVTLAAGLLLAVQAGASDVSNKWRLEFSGGAHSDGVITIVVTPKGGSAIETTTEIAKGTSENNVAKAVVTSLKAQLPADAYNIERDDGEDVLIKKKHGAGDFGVEITANTVKNVRINRDKE